VAATALHVCQFYEERRHVIARYVPGQKQAGLYRHPDTKQFLELGLYNTSNNKVMYVLQIFLRVLPTSVLMTLRKSGQSQTDKCLPKTIVSYNCL
jgi:hypothetical protein